MEQPKVERVLRLIRLMSGNSYLTVEQLAEKLDTSYRSIYRYIDTFKEVGFAIEKIHGNVYRLVKMPTGHRDLSKLVYFSDEEAKIVCNLIEDLDESNTLKAGLYKKLAAIYNLTSINDFEGVKSNSANVQALGNAIEDHKKVVLKNYSSAHSGITRDRLVEPFGFTNNHIDIWAFDIEHQETRVFKIHRIEWVDVLPDDWEFEDRHVKGYIDAFHMRSDHPFPIRLELNMRAKNLLCEEYPLAIHDIKEAGDGKWIFDSKVSALEGVGRFVCGLLCDVKILEGKGLKEYVETYVSSGLNTL